MTSDPDRQPPFLSYGFRPFFLLAGLYATLSIAVWTLWLWAHDLPGVLITPTFAGAPHLWHGHEMIFGFATAVISGFMLTAVPSWTGARRIAGPPLLLLSGTWLAGRCAVWFSGLLPPVAVTVVDMAYLPLLSITILSGLMVRPAPRNLVFLLFLWLLTAANGFVHAEWLGLTADSASPALAFAILQLCLMVAVIGGRIVPAFTRNVLMMKEPGKRLPASNAWIDRIALGSLALLAALTAFQADGVVTGTVALVSCIAHAARLSLWRGERTLKSPILWSLHVSYGFLVLGLGLLGLAHLDLWLNVASALHVLAIGGVSGMTLAVMTRASLGHTGRQLTVQPQIAVAYGLIFSAALLRGIGVEVLPSHYMGVVIVAGLLWVAGFGIFAASYWNVLTGPAVPKRTTSSA
jgi:uncharacterized protein involved in response to NO